MNRDKALDMIVRTLTEDRNTVDADFIRETFKALYGTDVRIDEDGDDGPLSHEQAIHIATMDWTADDNTYTLNEGWGIFDTGSVLEIERVDELAIFPHDDAAVEYVNEKAKTDAFYQKALDVINTYNVLMGTR